MSSCFLSSIDLTEQIVAESYVKSQIQRLTQDAWAQLDDVCAVSSPIGIIGGGLMGTAIGATCLRSAYSVVMCDTSKDVRNRLPGKIIAELTAQSQKGTEQQLEKLVRKQVHITDHLADLVECELIVETIPEKKKIKHKLYQQLQQAGFQGLLVSNTSTIEVARLNAPLHQDFQERFCVFHVFHPVRKRSLVEIVPSSHTARNTVATVLKFALDIDKLPIIVGDRPGFLVNRLLQPVLNESLILLQEGVPLENIENAALHFGMPMGPFRILDEIGLDVAIHSGWNLGKILTDQAFGSPIMLQLIEQGHLGRKTGKGFKRYSSETSWEDDGIVDPTWTISGLAEHSAVERTLEQIAQQLFLPMILEAIRAVTDGTIADYADADVAAVLGLGFPESRGGPCYFADSFGLDRILELLVPLEKKYGVRFTPPPTLRQLTGKKGATLRKTL